MTMRKLVTAFAVLVVLFLVSGSLSAQEETEERVKMKDLPEAVQKSVREQTRGARLRGLSKEVEDGKTYYEAELRVGKHSKDVTIDESGAVVEVEEEVPLKSLPAPARTAIVSGAGKGRIRSVERITKSDTVIGYEAHVVTAGKWSEIKVDRDGKPLSD
jgi:hypothetical protein